MPGESDSNEERQARSLALEKAYVHDVYDQIAPHFTDTRYRAWPRVKQFLLDLEPASLVADVGCGNGKYLDINPEIMKVGSDRCEALTAAARSKNHEVVTCDNLQLPFRDETFDAALSVAVIHHFATTDRRVAALKELARVLRIGGKVLITVWAMEQRHRKFDSQDVLVPWHEPVKSSSEDRGSSVERELTSTTTSDDDVLVYHAYSHISDSESQQQQQQPQQHQGTPSLNRRRQKFRNGRGRNRSSSTDQHHSWGRTGANSSQSSSELSSPNETCYSFVRRALQKLSNTASTPYSRRTSTKPYFYRSCRKPCISDSMEFGRSPQPCDPGSPQNDLFRQESLDSECQDNPDADEDVPIEIRHLEGYEPCMHCGSPMRDTGTDRCERHVCASCLPIESDSGGKKSRSLGDFLNMIPKLLRVKKCEKEPLSDLHKRISTASDPREYVVKSRGVNVNGIVRSKSTVSFMSRLEEIMSFSVADDRDEFTTTKNIPCDNEVGAARSSKGKPPRLPSLTSSALVDGECSLLLHETDKSTNPRRYTSPADALRKLRQDASMEESEFGVSNSNEEKLSNNLSSSDFVHAQSLDVSSSLKSSVISERNQEEEKSSPKTSKDEYYVKNDENREEEDQQTESSDANGDNNQEGHLSSYYSMPELYKLSEDQIPEDSIFISQRQRHISFYEQAETVLAENEKASGSNDNQPGRLNTSPSSMREGILANLPQRGLVKRSLSVDTGDNTSTTHQCPRRFSASAAQGVLASALRTYTLPRSSSRGSSVKSDTSVDSEESIVSVIPRKGNSITSDTSVDSEESVISVIQRSTSEIETLVRENGLRNISRLGSRSAQASPITVLSSQTSSAESSPPQSGKNDGRFPGSGGVIEQLMQQQQQQLLVSQGPEVSHFRHEIGDSIQRTRRCLLRPISDPKIEEKLSSGFSEEVIGFVKPGRRTPSNKGSLETDENIIREDEECSEFSRRTMNEVSSSLKSPVRLSNGMLKTAEKSELQGDDLPQTPSPVGPFRYINDPLLSGNPLTMSAVGKAIESYQSRLGSSTSKDSKTDMFSTLISNAASYSLRSLKPKEQCSSDGPAESPSNIGDYMSPLRQVKYHFASCEYPFASSEIAGNGVHDSHRDVRKTLSLENKPSWGNRQDHVTSFYDSILRGRKFESLNYTMRSISQEKPSHGNESCCAFQSKEEGKHSVSSSVASKVNDILPEETEEIKAAPQEHNQSGSGTCAKKCEPVDLTEPEPENKFLSTDVSKEHHFNSDHNHYAKGEVPKKEENLKEKYDDFQEIGAVSRDQEASEKDSQQALPTKNVDQMSSTKSLDSIQALKKGTSQDETESAEGNTAAAKVMDANAGCNTSPKSGKNIDNVSGSSESETCGTRCTMRKPLKRSCVTIDEVECREVASSDETSPSSAASLEWNDFDKVEASDHDHAPTSADQEGQQQEKPAEEEEEEEEDEQDQKEKAPSDTDGVEASSDPDCVDVNVAESETKFNVFLDKEICVFFETPSSSIGKSASSSSNATDFSTTSERIRGVMQREKSDDRSSKESDSDNLSKLSDLEAKSDSALSEDFARRTDFASSSSSASSEMIDSIRSRLGSDGSQSWCDNETSGSSKEKQASNWVLDNIDEIPDDDKHIDNDCVAVTCDERTRRKVNEWSDDKSLSFAQRRDNFFSCAADCRDMYRISFEDSSPQKSPDEGSCNATADDSESKEAVPEAAAAAAPAAAAANVMPIMIPEVPQLFPQRPKEPEENDAPTDILAAFVETISDLTSVFGELYPRHEGKFEDISSDDSIEISSFERILTSKDPQPLEDEVPSEAHEKDKKNSEVPEQKSCDSKRFGSSGGPSHPPPNSGKRDRMCRDFKGIHRSLDFTNRRHFTDGHHSFSGRKTASGARNIAKDEHEGKVSSNSSCSKSNATVSGECNDSKKDKDGHRKYPERARVLNHSSKSVCTDESNPAKASKQDDDESAMTTQSAPSSPRPDRKPHPAEGVIRNKLGDISRNSSLSQSTSQESLPGNESGGMMAYHRYYHVFRQGELDNLIENYVENLHIIASYYDHANWCVVAEKVQVWTI